MNQRIGLLLGEMGNSLGPSEYLFNHAINCLFEKALLDPEISLYQTNVSLYCQNLWVRIYIEFLNIPITYLSFFIDKQWCIWNRRFAYLLPPSNFCFQNLAIFGNIQNVSLGWRSHMNPAPCKNLEYFFKCLVSHHLNSNKSKHTIIFILKVFFFSGSVHMWSFYFNWFILIT